MAVFSSFASDRRARAAVIVPDGVRLQVFAASMLRLQRAGLFGGGPLGWLLHEGVFGHGSVPEAWARSQGVPFLAFNGNRAALEQELSYVGSLVVFWNGRTARDARTIEASRADYLRVRMIYMPD